MKYRELMNKVTLTEEMRARVLAHVQSSDSSPTPKQKATRIPVLRKYALIAACFAVLLLGTFTLRHVLNRTPQTDVVESGIVQVSSAEELEQIVHFPVPELTALPFPVASQTFTAYGSDLAEVFYEGGGQSACFRKSSAPGDVSGDYTAYEETVSLSVGANTVTLKGTDGLYVLAIWEADGFSYALHLSSGMDTGVWQTLLADIQ